MCLPPDCLKTGSRVSDVGRFAGTGSPRLPSGRPSRDGCSGRGRSALGKHLRVLVRAADRRDVDRLRTRMTGVTSAGWRAAGFRKTRRTGCTRTYAPSASVCPRCGRLHTTGVCERGSFDVDIDADRDGSGAGYRPSRVDMYHSLYHILHSPCIMTSNADSRCADRTHSQRYAPSTPILGAVPHMVLRMWMQ